MAISVRRIATAQPSKAFGINQNADHQIHDLFKTLGDLKPMDKNGPMSGRCGLQTDQMESFLSTTFGFKNLHNEYIVQGVKSFRLFRPPSSIHPDTSIAFPSASQTDFIMTIGEIIKWQQSFAVYADKKIRGMTKDFLRRALQGHSDDGEEAFRMKFVVRISTCPVLMEFDARVIDRKPTEKWPDSIKLVSVTGIDFAGRKHDVGDILYYIANWREVYETDPRSGLPVTYNGRDFILRKNCSPVKLYEDRVLGSLVRMARLRLLACDAQDVQVVLETGIGLGVFAGKNIGIDEKIRALSAKAVRDVLERDGPTYRNIRAIVFALPIFNQSRFNPHIRDTFNDFVDEFQQSQYKGPLPVLIADQDMHRLTVAIARQGFIVSQLNPADSHGVFGEYWQNLGPAVEEKLALTTMGLLVQHHLINGEVLNPQKYHMIDIPDSSPLDYWQTIQNDRVQKSSTYSYSY